MDLVLGIIGGLGIGSLLTAAATHYMSRRAASRDRWYQEKREAYLGLLTALHAAAVEPSDRHSKDYALWQTRCQLLGSTAVADAAQKMVETNDGPRTNRDVAFRELIAAMKDDLKN